MKKKLHLSQTLHQILQILSLTQFEEPFILSLFEKGNCKTDVVQTCKQQNLFDL